MVEARSSSAIILTAAMSLPCSAPSQAEPAKDWDAAVVKACEHRRFGMRLAVAKKIAAAGDAAVPAIRAYAADKGRNRVTLLIVDNIARANADGEATVALLEDWASDTAFYWRAQALRGLANRRIARLREAFAHAVQDPAHLVRIEGARGLHLLDTGPDRGAPAGDTIAIVRGLVDDDPDPRTRIRLAAFLVEQGDDYGLPTLLAALSLRDDFLGDPWGRRESDRALQALRAAVNGDDFGYDPTVTPTANAAAIAGFRAALGARLSADAAAAPTPAFRRADRAFVGGVAIRSCRHGDLFLRWTATGEVVEGLESQRSAKLGPAAWRRIRPTLDGGNPGVHGKVICDFLQLQTDQPGSRVKCAPGALPAGLAAGLDGLAAQIALTPNPQLADEIRARLPQFTRVEATSNPTKGREKN